MRGPFALRAALLLLCAAYLQGGLVKLFDFSAAVAEMRHFHLEPAVPVAIVVIAGELAATVMIVSGKWRWLGAVYLALFTLGATLLANPFWQQSGGMASMAANSFFEHIGLAGGFLLVAWYDLQGGAHGTAN